VLVVLTLFFPFVGPPIEVMIGLGSGWVSFLSRTVPQIRWNWNLVLMAVLCAALVLLGAQWFLNWIWQATRAAHSSSPPGRWPWKWTWCGLTAIAVFFLVGMSVGGITHQIGWMAASPEPMMETRGGVSETAKLRQVSMALEFALAEPNPSIARIRSEAANGEGNLFGLIDDRVKVLESYQILLLVESDGGVKGALVFPRQASRREKTGGWYILGDDRGPKPAKELNELIHRHRKQLVAL